MPSADQVPVKTSHSRCTGTGGLSLSPDRPALHYVLFVLPTFTSRRVSARSLPRRGKCDGLLVAFTFGHHGPRHPRNLVGEGDRSNLGWLARQQCGEPRPMFAATLLGIADDRQRAGHEQTAQISVALFAEAAEPFPTSARMLFRYQADPGREIPPRSEGLRISDAGDQSGS